MALARAVTFEGVTQQRIDGLKDEIENQERPEGLNPTEIVVLHDADASEALVVLFFDNAEDYRSGDAVLDAMPADETPGSRSSVRKYDVALRLSP
jgi:hypothetical protein